MREIKFRAWDKCNTPNKMIGWEDLCTYHSEMVWLFKPNHSQIILMQFTGLKDNKSGKEIYEGDIVKIENPYYLDNWEVIFEDGGFKWWRKDMGQKDLDTVTKVEVIGNIYENPELLKEQPK